MEFLFESIQGNTVIVIGIIVLFEIMVFMLVIYSSGKMYDGYTSYIGDDPFLRAHYQKIQEQRTSMNIDRVFLSWRTGIRFCRWLLIALLFFLYFKFGYNNTGINEINYAGLILFLYTLVNLQKPFYD